MAKKEPDPMIRKSVSLRRSVWEDIENYRRTERLGTEAEALRRLVQDRLKALELDKADAFADSGEKETDNG